MTKLEAMLKYVSEHNDFYKNRIKEFGITNPLDITQWPVLTRTELQKNRYNMFSDGFKTKYFDQQLRRQTSSGTSGIPVNVYWAPENYFASTKTLWERRLKYYNISPNDRCVMFTLRAFEKKPEFRVLHYVNKQKNLMLVNASLLNEELYIQAIKLIDDFKPKWLYISPYILQNLLNIYEKYLIPTPRSLEYIESVGEMLPHSLKNRATIFFSVPVANMYGSEEVNGIAYECPYGNMHIISKNVFLECPNNGDKYKYGEGEAIVTSLTNKTMPLIRYDQEDIIRLVSLPRKCLCGYEEAVVGVIKGRTRERLLIKSDSHHYEEINPYLLNEVMEEVNNFCGDKVTWFNFVYYCSESLLKCFITIDSENWFLMIKESIDNILSTKLGKAYKNIKFEVVLSNTPLTLESKNTTLSIVK